MFVVYTEALLEFFRRLKWLGQPVPVVHAGPDRAHGQMKILMAQRQSTTGEDIEELAKEIDEAAIPRPFIGVSMTLDGYDAARFSTFVHRGIAIDSEKGVGLSVQEARPENFGVQADIWCGDDWHMADALVFQLKSMFGAKDLPLFVDFTDSRFYSPPYQVPEFCKLMGKITCKLEDMGIVDNSGFTGALETPKEVRKTFRGVLQGWLPRMPFEVPLAEKLSVDVQMTDGETVEDVETIEIEFPR